MKMVLYSKAEECAPALSFSLLILLHCHILQLSIHCSGIELQPDVGIVLPCEVL